MPKAYFPLNGHSFALFLHCLLIVVNGLSFLTFHGASQMGGQIIAREDRIFLQWTVRGQIIMEDPIITEDHLSHDRAT